MQLATFNARVETIREKPMFRRGFQRTRCLIPVSGYYEWHDAPDGKQPYYFTRRDGAPITIAGIWDEWRDRQAGETIRSCAMIITEANQFVGELHDRMPVILEPARFSSSGWQSTESSTSWPWQSMILVSSTDMPAPGPSGIVLMAT